LPLDTRDSVIRREPAPAGVFVARIMRDRMGADVGLLNAGGIRGNRVIPSGPLSMLDVATLLPFRNTVALLEVGGTALRAILEHSLEALPRPNGRFLQTAGLDYTMDASRPAGSRILSASVGGRALEPARRYRVAVPDFLARGGDGYVLLGQARSLVASENSPGLIEIVVEALERGASP
jgi:5'-nucleotidase/UDP-sugar diphosphatase